jgi:hypothetical protein
MPQAQTIDASFPLKGLHVSAALFEQPEETSASLRNVRGHDSASEIARGGQRAGLTRECDRAVEAAVQVVTHFVVVTH